MGRYRPLMFIVIPGTGKGGKIVFPEKREKRRQRKRKKRKLTPHSRGE